MLFASSPYASYRSQILYTLHSGDIPTAVEMYEELKKVKGKHDDELLEQMGMMILERGAASKNDEVNLLTLFGAGISANEKGLGILEKGLASSSMQIQMVSLNFLAKSQYDSADAALKLAFTSPFPLIHFEAASYLAKKKHPTALGQIESLMGKVPSSLKPVFPRLLAELGTNRAMMILRQMLNDPDEKVRIEAILSIAETNRDDFSHYVRRLLSQTDPRLQEACAIAIGSLKDEEAVPRLKTLLRSPSPYVVTASSTALYQLGDHDSAQLLIAASEYGFPHAIIALGEIPGTEPVLTRLLQSRNKAVRLNAALGLLKRRSPACAEPLKKILVDDSKANLFTTIPSPGRALAAYNTSLIEAVDTEKNPLTIELSNRLRESFLRETVNLPEKEFLSIAEYLFEKEQNDLMPTVVQLLENRRSENSVNLLKKYQQKLGSPLIRNYCNLALVRLGVEGPYRENLRQWILQQNHLDLIRFRPFLPLEMQEDSAAYQLTPEESSKLFVEAIETMTMNQGDEEIDLLLETIKTGNHKNRFALAGLLMRVIH